MLHLADYRRWGGSGAPKVAAKDMDDEEISKRTKAGRPPRYVLGAIWGLSHVAFLSIIIIIWGQAALTVVGPLTAIAISGLLWGFWPVSARRPPDLGPTWPWLIGVLFANLFTDRGGSLLAWCVLPAAVGLLNGGSLLACASLMGATTAGAVLTNGSLGASRPSPASVHWTLISLSILTSSAAMIAALSWRENRSARNPTAGVLQRLRRLGRLRSYFRFRQAHASPSATAVLVGDAAQNQTERPAAFLKTVLRFAAAYLPTRR